MRLVEVPVGVGGADDPVPAPGDDEQHGRRRPEDQPGRGQDAVARDDEVDALGRADLELPALPDHRLGLVGPDAGGVDDLLRLDLELPAVFKIADPDADDPLPLAEEADHPGPARDLRAVGGGGPDDRHRVPGVVDLGVEVLHGADEGVAAAGSAPHAAPASGEVAVERQAGAGTAGAGQDVVERDARRRRKAAPRHGA